MIRDTVANRRWYGGGIPVATEPHQFWPMNADERKLADLPRLGLHCRDCRGKGLYGRDGKYRHAKEPVRLPDLDLTTACFEARHRNCGGIVRRGNSSTAPCACTCHAQTSPKEGTE